MQNILKVVTKGTHWNEAFDNKFKSETDYNIVELIDNSKAIIFKFPLIAFWLTIRRYEIVYFSDYRYAKLFKKIFGRKQTILTKEIFSLSGIRDFYVIELIDSNCIILN